MSTQTTTTATEAWRPDLTAYPPQDVLPDALILNHSTVAGAIEGDTPVVRVPFVTDDAAQVYAEGATFDEADPTLSEALVHTAKFGQLIRISREQYRQPGTDTELARSVARAITTKADALFLAQAAPTAPATAPVAGVANWTGIESQTDVAGLDPLIDLESTVRVNGGNPTAWILSPDCWAALRKLPQATTSKVKLLGAGTTDSAPMLLSIPVVVSAAMPSLTGLLIDRTAIISAVSQLEVAVSDQTYFASDSIAVRASMRTGHVLPRPNRIGKFTLAAA